MPVCTTTWAGYWPARGGSTKPSRSSRRPFASNRISRPLRHGVVLAAASDQQGPAVLLSGIDGSRRRLLEVRGRGLEERLAGPGDRVPVEQLAGFTLRQRVAEAVAELLPRECYRPLLVAGLGQHREAGADLGERKRLDPLDLAGVDRDRRRGRILGQQLLRDEAAERVADHDRPGRQGADDVEVAAGDVVDAFVCDGGRVLPRVVRAGRVAGPAGRCRVVAGRAVQLDPGLPGVGVDPQAVDEDDGDGWCGHVLLQKQSGWLTSHSASDASRPGRAAKVEPGPFAAKVIMRTVYARFFSKQIRARACR